MKKWLAAGTLVISVLAMVAILGLFAKSATTQQVPARYDCSSTGGTLPGEVPQPYNSIFTEASAQYKLDPALLAAIFESEHSNTWPNPDGPWASSPMGANGPFQFIAGTWAGYSDSNPKHPNGDVQNLTDAAYAAAHYLADLGGHRNMKPGDPLAPEKNTVAWVAGAYNGGHPIIGDPENDRYRENAVKKYLEYKGTSFVPEAGPNGPKNLEGSDTPQGGIPNETCIPITDEAEGFGGEVIKARLGSNEQWPVPMPKFPGERIDPRILGNAQKLAKKFKMFATDCYGGHPPHAEFGEHPVGAACDYVPADGNWDNTMDAARAVGWKESCAANGCEGTVKPPFRAVYYNGYPGHGDPAHCSGSCHAHIHFSWNRAPGQPGQPPEWIECFEDAFCKP